MKQVPQATWKQPRTRSPTATPVTASPAATTSPTYSWPIVKPGSIFTRPWKMCRSDPQTPVDVMRTSASPGASSSGSGLSTTSTRPGAWNATACISALERTGRGLVAVEHRQPGVALLADPGQRRALELAVPAVGREALLVDVLGEVAGIRGDQHVAVDEHRLVPRRVPGRGVQD